ncbi:MAG: hypothetical protein GC203_13920 [Phenylobacterium sp.]|uniref:hypothetical protein n=1 Tax=Phenylobacterium sp. TaxID=1871053 RepID=UPI0025DE9022|nr:hypothetical protein [Phenylobacterium sp.]MBI1198953.1 hypothetical protein [Phenylobacterium sp.]
MKTFIDLVGASGATYRFRLVPAPAQLAASAGNFAFLRAGPGQGALVCIGTALSLSDAANAWKLAIDRHQANAIYVRLNIARDVRLYEHQDIAERHAPTMIVTEAD